MFAATRRKRRADGESFDDDSDEPVHLARKKSARYQASGDDASHFRSESMLSLSPSDHPVLSHNGHYGHPQQHDSNARNDEFVNQPIPESLKGRLDQPGDGLQMLVKAANDDRLKEEQANDSFRNGPSLLHKRSASSHLATESKKELQLDPAILAQDKIAPSPASETLKQWSRLKFVSAGWFTAKEAYEFVE